MNLKAKEKNVQYSSFRGPETRLFEIKALSNESGANYTDTMLYLIELGIDAHLKNKVADQSADETITPAASTLPAKVDKPRAKSKDDSVKYDLTSWPDRPDVQIFKDWIKAKKRARGSVTQSTMNKVGKELHIAAGNGFSVNDCLATAESAAWRGFEAMWMKKPDTQVKRYSFEELGRGDHLEALQQPAQIESKPSYMDEFAVLELENRID